MTFTLKDMERFAGEAWGDMGVKVVEKWVEFNDRFFDGVLKPVPLVVTNAQPFGKVIAFCSYNPGTHGRTITLNVPRRHMTLLADNNALLHEMIHQKLFEAGQNAKHESDGWRSEIMRLEQLIAGRKIWAGRSITKRVLGDDGKKSKVIRVNEDGPNGEPSLGQKEIAIWPHAGSGVKLGSLGAATPVIAKPKRTRKGKA
jgi:hypothetical protein